MNNYIEDNNPDKTAVSEKIMMVFSVICSVFMLGWVFWYSRYGFDFSDEGFYLIWISNPFYYSVSHTLFGFIYYPLYKLLDGNIAVLRQSNILITYCLSWTLVNVFLKTVFINQAIQRRYRFVISSAIATTAMASFVFAGRWLPTPGYSSLALQALLVASIGLLMADKYANRTSIIGWFLIGMGGWLAFMAKPTTAAAFGLCVGFYLLLAGKIRVRLLAFSIVTAIGLTILSALVIDGSIISFVNRLKNGAEIILMLDAGHAKLFRFDDFYLSETAKNILAGCMVIIFFAAHFSQSGIKILSHIATMLSIVFGLVSLAVILGVSHETIYGEYFQGLFICSIPFASILAGFFIYRFKGFFQISRARWALTLILFVFPYVYAFGTANNYWVLYTCAGIFWVLAGFVFLSPIAFNRKFPILLLSIGLAVQMISVVQVHNGFESPYRQPQPLRANDYKIDVGKPGSTLLLSRGFAQYIEEAVNLANKAGFKKGMSIIDLTGQSKGILYAIGANDCGLSWGGYLGGDARVVAMLRKVTCQELAVSWLLMEPKGHDKILPEVLSSFGANLSTDFKVVGTIKTAEGAGGYKEVRVQQLLKPIRPVNDAVKACFVSREPEKTKRSSSNSSQP
ncbi:conserved membrane hypothetical protein [Gammaproteobacteria bacterium]